MKPWETKAHRLIAAMCAASYAATNHGRRRHRPYAVPADAVALIDCLHRHDEVAAKVLFLRRHVFGVSDDTSLA